MTVAGRSVRWAAARAVWSAVALASMILAPQVASASVDPSGSMVEVQAAVLSVEASASMAASDKDADADAIPDVVEREVCGSATCAVGTEDRDTDGIPDWTEVLSCDSTTCAKPTTDRDKDGIPDFAERLVCGTDTCSNSLEDADGDRIGDWVEFVICGGTGLVQLQPRARQHPRSDDPSDHPWVWAENRWRLSTWSVDAAGHGCGRPDAADPSCG